MPAKALSEKPPKVALAVKFFYAVVGLGIIRAAMTIIRHADVRSPYFMIFTKLIIYLFSFYLISQISKGKNWSRWTIVVIFILAIPLTILPAFAAFAPYPVHTILGFIQIALFVIGMVFLFHPSSSGWFGAEKISKELEQ
jgi:hypothetical protein